MRGVKVVQFRSTMSKKESTRMTIIERTEKTSQWSLASASILVTLIAPSHEHIRDVNRKISSCIILSIDSCSCRSFQQTDHDTNQVTWQRAIFLPLLSDLCQNSVNQLHATAGCGCLCGDALQLRRHTFLFTCVSAAHVSTAQCAYILMCRAVSCAIYC